MREVRSHALANLGDALYWAQSHWTVRELPLRLHSGRDLADDGTPRAASQFLAYLMANPEDTTLLPTTETCPHPRMARTAPVSGAPCLCPTSCDRHGRIEEPLVRCPDCGGLGAHEVRVERYRYPMWRALRRVASANGRQHTPHPIILVAALVLNAWDTGHAARFLSMGMDSAEPLFLMALRKLYNEYQRGPTPRRSWVDMSESQRNAESAA